MTRTLSLAVLAFLASGCKGQWSRVGWPAPVTKEGRNLLGVWYGSLVTAGIVGGFVILLILWAVWRYRLRDPGDLPRQVRYNLPIEMLYTIIPVVIISILFYFTAIRENDTDQFHVKPGLRIDVVGFQWSWQFNYLDDGLSITGRPGDPPQLVVPVGVPIRFYEQSTDVIHAWWVIPFLFKRDVIPGRVNVFQVTVTHAGLFQGKCTEYCGVDHDRMLFSVLALPKDQYDARLAQLKALAQAGTDDRFTSYTGPTTPVEPHPGTDQRSHS
ncbi:MAG: cytochrome c oxidase subunit [Frankiaceae bacterium]|nr:cytochrome c oxidase subunit [Frankiaceae bacterium]